VQTGIGGSPQQFAALGASPEHRVSVFEEGVRIVQALLAGETVSSERFGFADVSIGLVPDRPVDWWMGTANPAGLRRAARFGAAWYAFPSADPVVFDQHAAIYRDACAEHGTEPRINMRRDVMVLADGDEADRLGSGMIERGYRGQQRHQIDCGTPEQVAESLAAWADRGVDQIVTRTMGESDPTDLETVERLAEVARLLA
jgi:alkanesulfonate monooxygenase SsuD/methylene tetrahydromethanopterin reductase-like flavin-dependent oxidoreductase (luciferase family)